MRPELSRRLFLGSLTAALPRLGGVSADERLAAAVDAALRDRATSVLVARGRDVLIERHAPDPDAGRPREVASVAKSMVAILIGMAVEDGAIKGLDQAACDHIPAWRNDARAAITVRHLMSMTSGLDDAGLALRGVTGDQFEINSGAPLRAPPGSRWAYNTAAYHLLFHLLARATGERFESYAGRRLLDPLGMTATSWITNEGVGAAGRATNYYSAVSTARDLARFGGLILEAGGGLISPGMVTALTTPSQALNPSYGLLWWTNSRPGLDAAGQGWGPRFPNAPGDTVAALGAGGQAVMVVPSRRLIVVRQGGSPQGPQALDALLRSVLDTLDAAWAAPARGD